MSPDQIIALKKQGVDTNALISQHAMDIANEKGVDMGVAMAEAKRNIQAVDATLAETPQAEAPDPSVLQKLLIGSLRNFGMDKWATDRLTPSPDQPAGLTPAQKYAATYGDKGAYDITGGNLMDINAQALAGLSDISGLAEDRMRQGALMDMPVQQPTIGTPNLFDINKAALAGLSDISGLAEDRMRQGALMDMPSAAIGTSNLKDLDIQARAALMNDPRVLAAEALAKPSSALDPNELAWFGSKAAEAAEPSLGGKSTYERMIALGYTPSQIKGVSKRDKVSTKLGTPPIKPDQKFDIDTAMEMIKPRMTQADIDKNIAELAEGRNLYDVSGFKDLGYSPNVLWYEQQGILPEGGTKKVIDEEINKLESVLERDDDWYINQLSGDIYGWGGIVYELPDGSKMKFSKMPAKLQLKAAQKEKAKVDAEKISQIDEKKDILNTDVFKGNAKQNMDNAFIAIENAKNAVKSAQIMNDWSDIDDATAMLAGADGLNAALSGVKAGKPDTISKFTASKAFTGSYFEPSMWEDMQAEVNLAEASLADAKAKAKSDPTKENKAAVNDATQKVNSAKATIDKAKVVAKTASVAKAKSDADPANVTKSAAAAAVTPATAAVTPATGAAVTAAVTPAAAGAVTGALGTGLGGAFNEFVDPRSRADIISDIEADPYRGYEQVLAQMSANLPVTALTPQYERYLQRNVLPQMQTAFEAGGAGMAGTPTAGAEGSPFSTFEQFVRGGGGRLTSQGYQDLINEANLSLQAEAPTDRQAYLQSLYTSPESQRNLYAQGLRAGASGAVGDVIDRMVNRRFMQQQFQSPTTAFLPTALSPRTAYQTPSAIVGTGVPELDDPFMDYAKTGFGGGSMAEGMR